MKYLINNVRRDYVYLMRLLLTAGLKFEEADRIAKEFAQ